MDGDKPGNALAILMKHGWTCFRLRLWVDSTNGVNGLNVRIIIHIDCGSDRLVTKWYFGLLTKADVDYDVIGQSYYCPKKNRCVSLRACAQLTSPGAMGYWHFVACQPVLAWLPAKPLSRTPCRWNRLPRR
jgi:arabinogalactan endo-1,4-beta-galactosidase